MAANPVPKPRPATNTPESGDGDGSDDMAMDDSVPLSFSTLPTPRSGTGGLKRKDAASASFLLESKEREAMVQRKQQWPSG